jgi:hypothetical protein
MSNNLRRRLARVKAKQPKPKEDYRFMPWGTDDARAAWASVGTQAREELWQAFQRAGPSGNSAPCMVRRQADGSWKLSLLNTHLGGAEYVIMSAWQKLGYEAMYEWLAREATPDEIEALARMITSHWDPMALEPGDLEALRQLCPRLPRQWGRSFGSCGNASGPCGAICTANASMGP